MAVKLAVACGTSEIEFEAPDGASYTTVRPAAGTAIDVEAAAEAALRSPIGSEPLAALARPGMKACIVFTDATRDVPDRALASALLRHLEQAGVRDEDITLLCGVGMHRPSTAAEKAAKLGEAIVRRYRVLDSNASDPEGLKYLGDHLGVPMWVNRLAAEADLLMATGVVEPHQYAGYSGGRKTVAVGAGGEPTIAATHSPGMIERQGVLLGNIEGNPFHQALSESARRAGLRFIINVVKDGDGRIVEVAAGAPQPTFEHLVARARQLFEVSLDRQFDIVVAGVGDPKDANLYQASRAVTYVYFAPTHVLRPGGVIIVPAPCAEGIGQGVGEQRFVEAMRRYPSPAAVVEGLRDAVTLAGEQRAYLLSKALQGCRAIFVGTAEPGLVRDCHMTPAATMSAALQQAFRWTRPDPDILVVPHSLLVVLRGPEPVTSPGRAENRLP
ncbi:MAG: nickel-dependent lactate racemase family protein [Anaerolineae bacterium]